MATKCRQLPKGAWIDRTGAIQEVVGTHVEQYGWPRMKINLHHKIRIRVDPCVTDLCIIVETFADTITQEQYDVVKRYIRMYGKERDMLVTIGETLAISDIFKGISKSKANTVLLTHVEY